MFSQYMPTTWPCLKKSISSSFLQFSILRVRSCRKWSADIFFEHCFWHPYPDIPLWTSFRLIFWHSWHILTILSDILSQTFFLNFFQTYLLTFFLTYLVTVLQLLLWHILSATTTNPFDRSWGPARHTELAWSRLGSGAPHWTRRIAVEVRHATLNSRARGWGPARHTELTSSWVGVRHATLNSRARGWGPARHTELTSSRVEVRHATLNSQDRGWGPTRRRTGGEGTKEEAEEEKAEEKRTDIKSNNPHLTGGGITYFVLDVRKAKHKQTKKRKQRLNMMQIEHVFLWDRGIESLPHRLPCSSYGMRYDIGSRATSYSLPLVTIFQALNTWLVHRDCFLLLFDSIMHLSLQ